MLEGMLNDIMGIDLFDSIYQTLSINIFSTSGEYSGILNIVQELHNNAIKPIALMLMFIYFMIAIIDKLSSENFTWEQLWRQMAMLLASKFLIEHGFEILYYLFNAGMNIAGSIQSVIQGSQHPLLNFDAAAMIESFRESLGLNKGLLKVLGDIIMFIYLLIPWILSWILGMAVKIICYTRVVEIYVRATFAPIALSDFFHSGLQGSGWRFLKNFLAVSLQGGIILVIAAVFSALFGTLTFNGDDLFAYTGLYLSFLAAAVMLMFKSLSLAKELLGTGG